MSKRKKYEIIESDDEERYFLNPNSVSKHLYCSICQDVFTDPQRAPCGHSYCKKCIVPWLKSSRTCPEDRKTLHINQLHHDFILENIIGDQMVACPFRKSGCDFIGQLQRLASHKKTCDFNPVNLPEFLKKTDSPVDQGQADMSLNTCEATDEVIPSPGKPSLMMRLFRSGENQKKLLKSMFDSNKENESS